MSNTKDVILLFLSEVLNFEESSSEPDVQVTLTFAQSLDAKIAGKGGKQLILSCEESMFMTHMLRSKHDAILVGIGTALNDDPQLNTRLLPPGDGGLSIPLPVILDHDLRFRLDSKLMKNYQNKKGRQPTIITAIPGDGSDGNCRERRRKLEEHGARVLCVPSENGKLDLKSVLSSLSTIGVRSLMVEGGASIIASFLQSGLIDRLIVTVSPTLVGDGIKYSIGDGLMPQLKHIRSVIIGRDSVVAWRATRDGHRHKAIGNPS